MTVGLESYCDRPTWSPPPFNEIAYAATGRRRVRHQGPRPGDARAPADHVRRRQQREPGVRPQRPAPRVQFHPRRQAADLRDRPHGQGRAAIDEGRQQSDAGLVPVTEGAAMHRRWASSSFVLLAVIVALSAGACQKKVPPVARPIPPPPPATSPEPTRPPAPPEPVREPPVTPPAPIVEDTMLSASLDDINKNSPLRPVFFGYDSSDISARGAEDPRGQRRGDEEVQVVGDHDRGALRRTRHGRVQPRAGRTPRGGGPDLPGLARHPGRPHPRRVATARSSRSIRATPRRPGPRTGATISW